MGLQCIGEESGGGPCDVSSSSRPRECRTDEPRPHTTGRWGGESGACPMSHSALPRTSSRP
eukprot:4186527-Prymnesium_polylepis.2